MPRKTSATATRVATRDTPQAMGTDSWPQDHQAQAAQRRESKLDAFETELRQLVASTTDELNVLQSRYESELTSLRRAQVEEMQGLLQEQITVEQLIKQATDDLSSAYQSINQELQAAASCKTLDCGATEQD